MLMDIQMFSEPVLSLRGHKKAVTYVRYLNDKELDIRHTLPLLLVVRS